MTTGAASSGSAASSNTVIGGDATGQAANNVAPVYANTENVLNLPSGPAPAGQPMAGQSADAPPAGPSETEKLQTELKASQEMIGRQSKEVSETRKQIATLQDQLTRLMTMQQQAAQPPATPLPTSQDIMAKVQAGELTHEQGMALIADVAEQRSALKSEQMIRNAMNELLGRLEQEKTVSNFMQANPDYATLAQDGTLERVVAENPHLQGRSWGEVYHFHKAVQAQAVKGTVEQQNESLVKELAALKAEIEMMRKGARPPSSVTPTGASTPASGSHSRPTSYNRSDAIAGMSAAFEQALKAGG